MFIALAVSVGPGDPLPFSDQRAVSFANDLYVGWLVDVAKALTTLGTLWVVLPLCLVTVAILARWRAWMGAVTLVAGTTLVILANHLTKTLVDRPRPDGSLVDTAGSSYPSGHAAYAVGWVAVAVLLSRFVPWLTGRAFLVVLGIVVAVIVGLTRIYLQAHWFTDVVGGWGMAATIYSLCGAAALLVSYIGKNGART